MAVGMESWAAYTTAQNSIGGLINDWDGLDVWRSLAYEKGVEYRRIRAVIMVFHGGSSHLYQCYTDAEGSTNH